MKEKKEFEKRIVQDAICSFRPNPLQDDGLETLDNIDSYNRTYASLQHQIREAIAEMERGNYEDMDEVFNRLLKKYED